MSPAVDMSTVLLKSTVLSENPALIKALPSPHSVTHLLGSVNVDFDKSVLIQMALFSVLIVILKPLILDPMLRLFALREERTDGAKADARAMQERAAEILSNYEAEVGKVRAEASLERDTLRRETAQMEEQILGEARKAAEQVSQDGRARIATEIGLLEKELASQAQGHARAICAQVLGRELS